MTTDDQSIFERYLGYSLVVLITIIVLLVLIQVFSRYLVQLPFVGFEELARLVFVWACFLGTSLGTIQNKHISIDVLVQKFPAKLQQITRVASWAIIVFISAVMVYYGTQFTISKWAYPDYSTALFYPRSLFYLPVPICGAIILIYSLKEIPQLLRSSTVAPENPKAETEGTLGESVPVKKPTITDR